MIIRDTKYIIKRIIIGVSIALIVFLIKKNVFAKDVASVYNPFTTSNTETVSNTNTYADFIISGSPWANRGVGTLYFNFSVMKVSGGATDPIVVPTGVYANDYVCNVSSTSVGNSTFTASTYSAVCSVKMQSSGLTKISVELAPNQQNGQSLYRITISPLLTFETYDATDMSSTNNTINNQTTTITNNQNQNTQDIINNQNQNTQDIINNQNQNTQQQINSLRVCSVIDKNKIIVDNKYLTNAGNEVANNNFGITDYIELYDNAKLTLRDLTTSSNPNLCFYTSDKTKISCSQENSFTIGQEIPIPSNSTYVRFTIRKDSNIPTFNLCINGNQSIVDSNKELQNTITNSDVSQSNNYFDQFIEDFDPNTHGLTRIVLAPLQLIDEMLDTTCTPLSIPLPFVEDSIVIPCMSTIYTTHFSSFLNLYRLITDGIISYWVCINIFRKVKAFLDPTDDKVEVFEL